MRRTRGFWRYVGVAGAVLALSVGVVAVTRGLPEPASAADPAWQVRPGTFEPEDAWNVGPDVLVPYGPCYLAFGTGSADVGVVPARWRAEDDCFRPVRIGPPPQPVGDLVPGGATRGRLSGPVPAGDGEFFLFSFSSSGGDRPTVTTSLLRCDGSGACSTATRFEHGGPATFLALETGYVGVSSMQAWTSVDGIDWSGQPLPGATEGTAVRALAVGADGQVVAVGDDAHRPTPGGEVQRQPVAWVSPDRAVTWSRVDLPSVEESVSMQHVVFDGRRYLALGSVQGQVTAPALAYSSVDGTSWVLEPLPESMYQPRGALVTRSGAVVVLAASGGGGRQNTECAVAWVRSRDQWHREELGCHGVPQSLVELADGRIAGVHWGTLFIREPVP